MKIVSACLAGINCTYAAKSNENKTIVDLVKSGKAIPVCPEQLGGLATPRIPAEKNGNKIITKNGIDVTSQFVKGALEGLKIAKMINCKEAILKSNSPSCGSGQIYDGSFTGKLIPGDGIFAALLKKNGIVVQTEKDI
jgi:uncharacterized protein YbbK (DUF523 family)